MHKFKKILLHIFLVVLVVFAVIYFQSSRVTKMNDNGSSDDFEQNQTNTPGNSAPPFAITACVNKNLGDECQFIISDETINGVCFSSGDTLACGYKNPEINRN